MKQGVAPYVPKDVLAKVIEAQKGKNALRNKVAMYLTHYLGLRAKEAASLRICDIYDQNAGIKEDIRLLASMTKGERFREVFLVDQLTREAIGSYLATRSLRRPEAPLLLSQKGGAFTANTMQKMIGGLYRKANVRASSHSGRRSFATNLIESGADIHSVKELMGHESINTTQVYFTTSPTRLKRLVSML